MVIILKTFFVHSSDFKAMTLKFGPCEFLDSNKEVVYIHHIEDWYAFIWSMELKPGEIVQTYSDLDSWRTKLIRRQAPAVQLN